jgi:hypothetical protein
LNRAVIVPLSGEMNLAVLFKEGDPEIARIVGNIARGRRSFANWVGMLIAGMLLVGFVLFAIVVFVVCVSRSGWSKGLATFVEVAEASVVMLPYFLLATLPRIWAELRILALRNNMSRATCVRSPAVVADVSERVVEWGVPGNMMTKSTVTLSLITDQKEEAFVMPTMEFYLIGGALVFPKKVAAKGLLIQATYLVAPDGKTWLVRLGAIAVG